MSLGIGAITVVVGLYLSLRGGVPARWSYQVTWCFLIMASWFVVPAWLGLLARVQGVRLRDTSKLPPFVAVVIGMVVYAAIAIVAADVQIHLTNAHRIHGPAIPFLLNFVAACVSAIPLAFSAVALSRHVADRPGWPVE